MLDMGGVVKVVFVAMKVRGGVNEKEDKLVISLIIGKCMKKHGGEEMNCL